MRTALSLIALAALLSGCATDQDRRREHFKRRAQMEAVEKYLATRPPEIADGIRKSLPMVGMNREDLTMLIGGRLKPINKTSHLGEDGHLTEMLTYCIGYRYVARTSFCDSTFALTLIDGVVTSMMSHQAGD